MPTLNCVLKRLAWLLAERGDLDELRVRADAGDEQAAGRLAEVLARPTGRRHTAAPVRP
jgi:hypothetical protein